MDVKNNPKVECVQLISAILQIPQSEILTNKTLTISEIIKSENGNEGGLVPFDLWQKLQISIGEKTNLI